MKLRPSQSDLDKAAESLARHETLKAFCFIVGPVAMGSGIGQLLHGSVVGAVLIVISLPFIAVTVASALLGRRQRRQLEVLRQRVSRLAATVTVYQVVSKLQPGASCIVSWGGSSDEVERPAASSDEG